MLMSIGSMVAHGAQGTGSALRRPVALPQPGVREHQQLALTAAARDAGHAAGHGLPRHHRAGGGSELSERREGQRSTSTERYLIDVKRLVRHSYTARPIWLYRDRNWGRPLRADG